MDCTETAKQVVVNDTAAEGEMAASEVEQSLVTLADMSLDEIQPEETHRVSQAQAHPRAQGEHFSSERAGAADSSEAEVEPTTSKAGRVRVFLRSCMLVTCVCVCARVLTGGHGQITPCVVFCLHMCRACMVPQGDPTRNRRHDAPVCA